MRWEYFIERYRSTTNIAGTVLVAWILSAIVAQAIGLFLPDVPVPTGGTGYAAAAPVEGIFDPLGAEKRLDYYMPICLRNIFDSQKRAVCEQEVAPGETEAPLDLNSPPQKSDLAATLLGTMVFTNPNRSFATIQPKSGGKGAENFYVDQMIQGEAKIVDIQRNKVFFVRNGHREYLEVENLPNIFMTGPSSDVASAGPAGGARLEGDKAILSRAKVDATLGDLNQVIQQARMVPNQTAQGQVNGFKIFAIKPGSIFMELGLKNGDIIERINGTEINSVERAIPMLQLARSENMITIDLTRNGAKKTLSIDIR